MKRIQYRKKRRTAGAVRELRRSVWTSALAMLLCLVLLAGTTFAWFTASVKNENNSIAVGTLSMEVTAANTAPEGPNTYSVNIEAGAGVAGRQETLRFAEAVPLDAEKDKPFLIDTNIEPGKTSAVLLSVNNTGTLGFQAYLDLMIAAGSDLKRSLWFDFVSLPAPASEQTPINVKPKPMEKLAAWMDEQEFGKTPGASAPADTENQYLLIYGMYESAGQSSTGGAMTLNLYVYASQNKEGLETLGGGRPSAAPSPEKGV